MTSLAYNVLMLAHACMCMYENAKVFLKYILNTCFSVLVYVNAFDECVYVRIGSYVLYMYVCMYVFCK